MDGATDHTGNPARANSETSIPPSLEKESPDVETPKNLEVIRTVSKIPGNPNYYEKDGLRTYGDDEDHDHEPPVSLLPSYLG